MSLFQGTDLNPLRYDAIDEGTQYFNSVPQQESSFHDIYTLKGEDGDIQRIHYAVDDNGPRANFQSNTVRFQENFVPTNNYFGARINIRPPDTPNGPQENYPTSHQFKAPEDIKSVPGFGAAVGIYGHPEVLPSSFVSLGPSPPQSEIQPIPLSFDEKNTQNLENRLSTEYETSPIEQAIDSPFILMDQIYDSQRIPKPLSDDMTRTAPEYFSFLDNVPNSAAAYTPLLNNEPKTNNYEYQQKFDSIPLDINRFNHSKNNEQTLDKKNRKPFAASPLNSLVAPAFEKSTPVPLQILLHEPKSEVSHEVISKQLGGNLNFKNGIYPDAHSSDEITPKSSEADLTTILQKNISPKLESYFTKEFKLSPSLKSVPSFSESLIHSPMSTVFDTSNENGKYYHYVMNLGQSSQKNEKGKSEIFSTGNALYKLLKEVGMPVQPSISKKGIESFIGRNLKKQAKVSGIASEKVKSSKVRTKKVKNSIAKLMLDLQTAGNSIHKLNLTQENPSVNLSIPIKFNKKKLNVSGEMLMKISQILNRDKSEKQSSESTSTTFKFESSTPTVATESYTVSPFLEELFDVHEEIIPFTDTYQEITTTTTQSSLESNNAEAPLFITVPQNASNLSFASSHSTNIKSNNETSQFISTLPNENTITSTLPTQKMSVTEVPTTSKPILPTTTSSSTTSSEEASSPVPTSTSVPTTSFEVIFQTTMNKKNINGETGKLSTVSYEKETTTDSSTDSTTLFKTSISPINNIGNELPTQRNNDTLNTIVNVEAASSEHSLVNTHEGNLVKSKDVESEQPMLELMIPSTEMEDFMSKINNMPIFIRVLNPILRESQTKSTAADNSDVQKNLLDLSQFSISSKTNFTSLNLPDSNKANLNSKNHSMEGKIDKNLTLFKKTKSKIKFPIKASKNNNTLSELKVLKTQPNGYKAISENIYRNSSDIPVEDKNTSSFTPLGEESKARVEVLRSNEPLHLIPIFYEGEPNTSEYVDFNTFPDANIIKPINDDTKQRIHFDKPTNQQFQNDGNKNITYFPLSIEYVAHTPYRDFNINDEVSHPIPVGYDSNNAFTYKYNSVNVTDGFFQNAGNNNDYEFSPSLEYIDLPYPEVGNNDRHTFLPVKDQLENRMRLMNTNKTLFQNVREIDNGYDLSLPHEYLGIDSYGSIDINDQGHIFVPEDSSNKGFLDRFYSSNIPVSNLQNGTGNINGYTQSQPVNYVEFIPSREHNQNVQEPNDVPNNHFVVDAIDEFSVGNGNINNLHDSASSNTEKLTFNNKYIDFMHYGDPVNNIKRSDAEENDISDTFFILSDYGDLPISDSNINNLVLLEDNSNLNFESSVISPQVL